MTWIKHNNPTNNIRVSSAAYNFVELPDKVVKAVESVDELPNHNTFSNSDYPNTGHFIVKLTTKTPLYVRSSLTPKESEKKAQETEGMNFRDKLGNKPDFFYTNDSNKESSATIPGSSLRGMLRNLLEIVSYSKISFVQNLPKIFYRAVAAPRDDSLGDFYKEKIKNLKVGYLKKNGEMWKIIPAKNPKEVWSIDEKKPFLTIKDEFVTGKISNFLDYNDENYQPQFYKITFEANVESKTDDNGKTKKYLSISNIGDESKSYSFKGFLVCSGNMLENDSVGTSSPRKRHSIVLEKAGEEGEIGIPQQVVKDYKDSLTPFLKESPFTEKNGCLKDGNPVFYLEEDEQIVAFGHTPNFRLPAYDNSEKRSSTPLDFVPSELKDKEKIDFAEAMFGFIKNKENSNSKSYSSRILITDAKLYPTNQSNIFLPTVTPSILASPKPTTFQHYLVQASENRSELKHYSNETPDKTVIRGHKLYWHRGITETDSLLAKPNSPNVDANGKVDEKSKIHTQFTPVKAETSFEFKVYFENFSNEELGALCWVLKPQGENDKTYFQKLGMGKAFGMGAIHLEADLFLENRISRYKNLFDQSIWNKGETKADIETWKCLSSSFEKKILIEIQSDKENLNEVERIKMLLKMLEWSEKPDLSFKITPDFEAENNDFKERRVLPSPLYKKAETIVRKLVLPKKI